MDLATTKAKKKKPKKKSMVLNVDGVDLPVTFNTTGRLDKKSQDAFNDILNRKLAQGVTNRFDARDAVEIAGFTGLVALNYYGVDLLGMFLGDVGKAVRAVIKEPEEFVKLVAFSGVEEFNKDLIARFIDIIGGMPEDVVKAEIERSNAIRDSAEGKIIGLTTLLELQLRTAQKRGDEATAERAQKKIDEINTPEALAELKAKVKKEAEEKLINRLSIKKIAIATGLAYAQKKFLESYEFSEAAENLQFLG